MTKLNSKDARNKLKDSRKKGKAAKEAFVKRNFLSLKAVGEMNLKLKKLKQQE